MKLEAQVLLKVVNFLYNKNIDIIKEVYVHKVPGTMVAHLIDRAQMARDHYNNNELAWIDFVRHLDGENLQILAEYIFKNA